jgi:succinate dehydrogenase / fumarate reductase cytochrome b subunit
LVTFFERQIPLASLVLTIRETLRYRGAIGQWSWVLHRLTGLGVVFFLVLHVIDTSWAVFYPDLYEKAIAAYQSPLFTIGEFGLVFAVVYHAFNGLRIAIFDFQPRLWAHQARAAWVVLGATVVVLVPVFIGMGLHAVEHYQDPEFVLPISEVLIEQLPFIGGMVAAAIAALVLSAVYGMIVGNDSTPAVSAKNSGSKIERFWWSFMRVSGLLIVPLVFGHLAMLHIVQGVFDITLAGHTVVGTGLINESGTATEFVAHRWGTLTNTVTIWRVYDIALLALVTLHGFNGLRYVLTDYTMESPLLRRAMVYLTIIGGVVLLGVGGAALLGSIDNDAIELATNALEALKAAH